MGVEMRAFRPQPLPDKDTNRAWLHGASGIERSNAQQRSEQDGEHSSCGPRPGSVVSSLLTQDGCCICSLGKSTSWFPACLLPSFARVGFPTVTNTTYTALQILTGIWLRGDGGRSSLHV